VRRLTLSGKGQRQRDRALDDARFMRKAIALAERGRGTTSPNPMVGALVVDADGVIVGRGAHRVAGGPHAEVIALDDAGTRARGATLYCTLEPCSHTGRTGPCAPLVTSAGITRAVIAIEDPNPLVQGRGLARNLIAKLIRRQVLRGETPFLHVMRDNVGARRTYERMGFRHYRETVVRVVSRSD